MDVIVTANFQFWTLAVILAISCYVLSDVRLQKSVSRPFILLRKRLYAWEFLWRGPAIIQAEYEKANGRPFVVDMVDKHCLFVTSSNHVEEISAAPDDVLSLQAVAKVILQPTYTMHYFNWFDQRGVDGTPLVRSLRTMLTNNIPNILPDMHFALSALLDSAYGEAHETIGLKCLPLYPLVMKTVGQANAMAFFGTRLAHDSKFMEAAVKFIDDTLMIAECVRLLPKPLSNMAGNCLSKLRRSHHIMYDIMMTVTCERLEERERGKHGHAVPRHNDCIQWVMENSPRKQPWTAQRIVHELIALWFGSFHAMSISICFTVHELYLHPEYLPALRMELESSEWQKFTDTGNGLPLLDSFIKESTRINPLDALSSRRQALKPMTLSGGYHIDVGDWIAVPFKAMMRDNANYERATEFHGFRFVASEILASYAMADGNHSLSTEPASLTNTTDSHTWGSGRLPCPGRFYAAASMKMIVGLIISKYEGTLADPEASRWVTWRGFSLPKSSTTVLLQSR